MRKIALLLLITTLSFSLLAQDAAKEAQAVAGRTAKNEGGKKVGSWTKGGIFNLNINQGGYDNWIPAGDANTSLGVNGYLNLFANKEWKGKKKAKTKTWTNNLDIFEAILNTKNDAGVSTNNKLDDRIDFLSRYSVQLKDKINFSTVANMRTQLYDTKANGDRINGFFAPAVVTLAPGFEWKPNSWFSAFYSPLSSRWVVVSNGPSSIAQSLYKQRKAVNPDYSESVYDIKPFGVDQKRQVDWQVGSYASFNVNKDLSKNINFKSRLDLYSNYANNPQNVDIFFTNFLNMKVNKYINVGISLDLVYDDDFRNFGTYKDKAALQYKHLISVGFGYKF
jgi:hypothetical protein